ncbi:MAG: GNAT family N-acetyltransferase, partial [Dehalococcoidales bacterium]
METAKDYYVRRMRREDVGQVVDIDREAFPSIWPVPNYRRELENRLAHYIVVCDRGRRVPENDGRPVGGFKRFNSMVWRLLGGDRWHRGDTAIPGQELILGFAGIWVLVDEAHLTNIAVRELERERGVGELLLISIIEMSQKLKAIFVTLEVRASNTTAQNLYTKYGFKQVGVR